MSVQYCHNCDKHIDTDFDAEHFDDNGECEKENTEISLNCDYKFSYIEKFAEQHNYDIEELGKNVVGENFLVLKHRDKDLVISFVLTGTGSEYIYKCIYGDQIK